MEISEIFKSKLKKESLFNFILFLVLVFIFLLSLSFGRYKIEILDILKLIFKKEVLDQRVSLVFYHIRLPRVILAVLVGMALASAGSVYQSAFRNSMASPDILGASQGAAFGASLAIILDLSSFFIIAFAFLFSIFSVLIAFFIAKRARGKKVINLILAGMMVSSLFGAGVSYIKLISNPNTQLAEISFWLMGSLSATKKEQVYFAFSIMALSYIPLFLLRWHINVLALDDKEAKIIGVNIRVLRLISLFLATLLIATAVSVSGIISWIGLIIPHFARKMVGNNLEHLFLASSILGAIFLLLVDNISRNLLKTEIPIGILTALVGSPFFLYLFSRKE